MLVATDGLVVNLGRDQLNIATIVASIHTGSRFKSLVLRNIGSSCCNGRPSKRL